MSKYYWGLLLVVGFLAGAVALELYGNRTRIKVLETQTLTHQQENRKLREKTSTLVKQLDQRAQLPQPQQDTAPPTTPISAQTLAVTYASELHLSEIDSMPLEQVEPELKRLTDNQAALRREYETKKRLLAEIQSNIRRKEIGTADTSANAMDGEQNTLAVLREQEKDIQVQLTEIEARLGKLGIVISQLEARKNILKSDDRTIKEQERQEQKRLADQSREETRRWQETAAQERAIQSRIFQIQKDIQKQESLAARTKGEIEAHERTLRIQQNRLSQILRASVGIGVGAYETQADKHAALQSAQESLQSIVAEKSRAQGSLLEAQENIKALKKSLAEITGN